MHAGSFPKSQLCIFNGESIKIVLPVVSERGGDVSWSITGKSLIAIAPLLDARWSGQRGLSIIEVFPELDGVKNR